MSRSKPTPASWRSVAGARADVAGILRLGGIVQPIARAPDGPVTFGPGAFAVHGASAAADAESGPDRARTRRARDDPGDRGMTQSRDGASGQVGSVGVALVTPKRSNPGTRLRFVRVTRAPPISPIECGRNRIARCERLRTSVRLLPTGDFRSCVMCMCEPMDPRSGRTLRMSTGEHPWVR